MNLKLSKFMITIKMGYLLIDIEYQYMYINYIILDHLLFDNRSHDWHVIKIITSTDC